ncbi:ABC transporter ATP-binding protein [Flavimobilis marinus]|uniref:ATPase components of ABC transporters with duplicated ATPase domains n=1 Tax=Flavimobilis marinus TaxID=285351 RepID=A0A1I2I3K8_9MICO|nr:ABC-F family ATP-binding cassette domain-containing protein [Flavimobilis marinus]GHG56565.1 ABC transporter ATP-binding protein [Flavimobilis marinus]SFF36862.1 ATPase components of ABC transporters with duplicated ATPase domains [Flavimobilis marinus]
MAHLLGAESLHVAYPNRTIFDSVSLGLDEGDRIGIVGRNGDGKSTLMRLLSGRIEPHGGRVTVRRGVQVAMLDQADTLDPDQTVGHAIVGDIPEHEWAGDAKVRDVISGLVSDIPWDARIGDLSGGQRRRTALAAVLMGDHDAIFLDEPTNHLDLEGVTWLARHLKQRWTPGSGGLLVVTHDRWFLDEVCTTTWEVHDGVVDPFEGGYAAYVLQRVERDRMAAASESRRQNLMRKELAWLRRGAPARTSKPKFRIEAANQLIADEPPVRDTVSLAQMATSRLGKDVVDLLDVGVSYGDKEVLRGIEWRIAPGERTGILGVNGAGKSTLLKLVTGELEPTVGRVKRGKTVRVVTLTQDLAELKEIEHQRVNDVIASKRTTYVAGGKEMTPGQLLERLGFTNAHLATPVKDLSGGQRRRLQLLMILLDEPNVLVLDEPTNDMDTDMLAAIEDLLDSWPGTLLVVSHDRYLLERVTDQQYAVLDGGFRHLPGGVDEYLTLRAAQVKAGTGRPTASGSPMDAGSEASAGAGGSAGADAASTLSSAEQRAVTKEIGAIERRLSKLDAQIKKLHAALAAHDQADFTGLAALTADLRALEDEVGEQESRWLELSEQV